MKLLRVSIFSAATCGGLLDGFTVSTRHHLDANSEFAPICLIGPNGTGKSQFLQVIADIFQSIFHTCDPHIERDDANPDIEFEIEYQISTGTWDLADAGPSDVRVRISRKRDSRRRLALTIEKRQGYEWESLPIQDKNILDYLPSKIVGYTSGGNETLSMPFLISRAGYAEDVGKSALGTSSADAAVSDTRLMLVDYGTNLEVLVSNLLFCTVEQRSALLSQSRLNDIRSLRCIIQLAHSAAPKTPVAKRRNGRKGVQLTKELETYIDNMKRCSTCHSYDEITETYVFDYWVNAGTKTGFREFWEDALDLYTSLHKLAMLNDLVISREARTRFQRELRTRGPRRFASRMPEPQDDDKVFRFNLIRFTADSPETSSVKEVDYVSLSDGEHQLTQLLGTLCMISRPNVLFLLDEPESHFNPEWRVKFMSTILSLPTNNGIRSDATSLPADQECILTTHAPFVPSDMPRERVLVFAKEQGKITVRNPSKETYGATFDAILEDCFDVHPPISKIPQGDITALMKSTDRQQIEAGLDRLGHSIEKVFLADRLRQLNSTEAQ